MSTLFIPSLWSDKILDEMRKVTGISRALMGAPYPTNQPLASLEDRFHMKMDATLEAFFVALALEHGTHPEPTFGITRNNLAREIAAAISEHEGAAVVLRQLRRNYAELGGKSKEFDLNYFYGKIADAYLDWLYSQPESMALMEGALAKLNSDRTGVVNTRDIFGFKPLKL